ncbi:MAG: helix-turn-helix domain-containing protein [Ruminococcaceae bacterium]|nr:helix-turn-helix domain-containing protein [Oscillospiraceae bacterium]
MKSIYENLSRGTQEFPFERYDFDVNQENLVLTQTHFHNEFEILAVKKGEITLLLEGESIILKDGDIAFINPNEYHALKTTKGLAVYTAFVFSKELITFPENHFFQTQLTAKIFSGKAKLPTILSQKDSLYQKIKNPILKMRDSYTAKSPMILSLLVELFTIFLENNMLIKVKNQNKKIPDYIKLCIDYISENCEKNISLSDLSTLSHVTPNHLCLAFKNATGLTPIEHLQVIRIKKATRLLLETDFSIEEIAQKCGFQNVGYFIRVFKKQNSLTPHTFRKKMAI